MNYNHLCLKCMHEKPSASSPCPHCGYYPDGKPVNASLLQPGTILNGHYLIGLPMTQQSHIIEYCALDLDTEQVVTIRELYLTSYMRRSSRFPGRVRLLNNTPQMNDYFQNCKNSFLEDCSRAVNSSAKITTDAWIDCFAENGTAYAVKRHKVESHAFKISSAKKILFPESLLLVITSMLCMVILAGSIFFFGSLFRDHQGRSIYQTEIDSDDPDNGQPSPAKSKLTNIFTDNKQPDNEHEALTVSEYTYLIYIAGSNLESESGCASADIREILGSGIDCTNVNVLFCTGGSSSWAISSIPDDKNAIFVMQEGGTMNQVSSTSGIADMGSSETLASFLDYAYTYYPARHYALTLWNHGGGAVGGFGADELFDYDAMYLDELKEALDLSPFGGDNKLDWVGYDACLMASIEIADVWKDYAEYFAASQELEMGDGWDYSSLSILNTTSDPRKIIKQILDDYAAYYRKASSPMFNPAVTFSCLDLGELASVTEALDIVLSEMTKDIENGNYSAAAKLRADTRQFDISALGRDHADDTVDLYDLALKLKQRYGKMADRLLDSLERLVIYETSNIECCGGISMYFPFDNMDLYYSYGKSASKNFLDDDYVTFVQTFMEQRSSLKLSTDWDIGNIRADNDGYTISLTEEQAENLAYASYSILKITENGTYTPVLSDCLLEENEQGILFIPKDLSLMMLENDETSMIMPLQQLELVKSEALYSNKETHVLMTEDDSVTAVTITFCHDIEHETLSVRSTNYLEGDTGIAAGGKEELKLNAYGFLGYEYAVYSPRYDHSGNLLPYKSWNLVSSETSDTFTLDDSFSANFVDLRETSDSYVMQVVIQDTTGRNHASNIIAVA